VGEESAVVVVLRNPLAFAVAVDSLALTAEFTPDGSVDGVEGVGSSPPAGSTPAGSTPAASTTGGGVSGNGNGNGSGGIGGDRSGGGSSGVSGGDGSGVSGGSSSGVSGGDGSGVSASGRAGFWLPVAVSLTLPPGGSPVQLSLVATPLVPGRLRWAGPYEPSIYESGGRRVFLVGLRWAGL
jgi:hypothetical protein